MDRHRCNVTKHRNRKQLADRAKQLYEESIRIHVEPTHIGEFVVIDVENGDYEVAPDKLEALDRLRARNPAAQTFVLRVGSPTAAVLGGANWHRPQ